MVVLARSAKFVRISIGSEYNFMHAVCCILDTGVQYKSISKEGWPIDWFAKICREVQLSLRSAAKDRPETNGSITLHVRTGDLITGVLFTVVENLSIGAHLGTAFNDEHVLAILPNKQKVAVCKSTLVAITKQHNGTANAVYTKNNFEHSNTYTEIKTNEGQ